MLARGCGREGYHQRSPGEVSAGVTQKEESIADWQFWVGWEESEPLSVEFGMVLSLEHFSEIGTWWLVTTD